MASYLDSTGVSTLWNKFKAMLGTLATKDELSNVLSEEIDDEDRADLWLSDLEIAATFDSSVTTLKSAYQGSNFISFPSVDTSNVTDVLYAFKDNKKLERIGALDLSNCTNMNEMCQGCDSLKSPINITTSNKLTNLRFTFAWTSLTEVPTLTTSNVTTFNGTFYGCNKLKHLPETPYDFSKATNISQMFVDCRLLEIPEAYLNLTAPANILLLFAINPDIKSIGYMNYPNATNVYKVVNSMKNLEYWGGIEAPKATTFGYFMSSESGDPDVAYSLKRIEKIVIPAVMTQLQLWLVIIAEAPNLEYCLIKDIGLAPNVKNIYLSRALPKWGTGSAENRQSLIDSLITYSHDRVAAGLSNAKIYMGASTIDLLTQDEIALITAKGYTLVENG